MSIPQFITDNTDDGRDIIRFLIDVMNDDLDGARLNHRLAAARLLVIYQHADASDFIAGNTPDVSDSEWGERIRLEIDPVISSLIKLRSDGGRELCLFLIDVMKGKVEGIHVGHRVSAAKELLNRAFGRSPSRPLPKTPRSKTPTRRTRQTHPQTASVHPEPIEGPTPVHPELVEGPEPVKAPERMSDEELQARIYRSASRCIDPNFDPKRFATDDDYFWSYDGCDDIRCPYHGDPEDPDFYEDPNDHHY